MDIRNERRSTIVGHRAAMVITRPGNVNCPHCGGKLGEVILDPNARGEIEVPCECAHPRSDHRGGGLCETCMDPTDSTGMWSACQTFRPRRPVYEWPPEMALAAERAHIRAELLEWAAVMEDPPEARITEANLRTVLDRICPEEG